MNPLEVLAIAASAHFVAIFVAERLTKKPRRGAALGILRVIFWLLTMIFGVSYFISIADAWWEQWGWAAVYGLLALWLLPDELDYLADTLFPNQEETSNHD